MCFKKKTTYDMLISDWSSDVCSSDLSGALYRAVGLAAAWADIDLSDADALLRCTEEVRVQFREAADPAAEPRVLVNGVDATDELRTETAGAAEIGRAHV